MKTNQSFYFGGSRHLQNINPAQIAAVVAAVVAQGNAVHVGCQAGADQAVVSSVCSSAPALLHAFVVASSFSQAPKHIQHIPVNLRARVTYGAGTQAAHIPARYLLRSIAAFQGCASAVFFAPGSGSLAVAREAVKAGLGIFAFSQTVPAPIPSTFGNWVSAEFFGFSCYSFYYPTQPALL